MAKMNWNDEAVKIIVNDGVALLEEFEDCESEKRMDEIAVCYQHCVSLLDKLTGRGYFECSGCIRLAYMGEI